MQLLLLKELLLYCGDGYYPLVENSIASSYLATIIYLDKIDYELNRYLQEKVGDISEFQMIRYVDDLYIIFNSFKDLKNLSQTYNDIKNEYSSILKKYGLSLNVGKCKVDLMGNINHELKKSLYDEAVNNTESDIGSIFPCSMESFLKSIYDRYQTKGMTNEEYILLVEDSFSMKDIEYTATEVYNHFIYENQTELKKPEVTRTLVDIINKDVSFLSIDPKRLSVLVMQSGNNRVIKAMLNQLFKRERAGTWNSYDTTIAIAYLIQSKFKHIDLLSIIRKHNPNLHAYYAYCCGESFLSLTQDPKWNRILRCLNGDTKAAFLFFMSCCEKNRNNYLGSYAYYKNFFDRISADMAHLALEDGGCKKANYRGYYKESVLKKLYYGIIDSDSIIEEAHRLRNSNPLSHSSADLIDKNSSSVELNNIKERLEYLIDEYSMEHGL